MGWQDRDYRMEEHADIPQRGYGVRRPPGGTLGLMIVHGLAFLLMLTLKAEHDAAAVPLLALVDPRFNAAGILLHPYATNRVLSAAFVLLAFWSLSGQLELRLGTWRIVRLYVIGNLAAGAAYLVAARLAPSLASEPLDYPAGALAAMVAVAWRQLRQDQVMVLGRLTTRAKVYAVCAAIVVALVLLRAQQGASAWVFAVAVGGGAGGLSQQAASVWSLVRRRSGRPFIRRPPSPKEPYIDDILEKISHSGLDSLTDVERERLEAARRAKLGRKG